MTERTEMALGLEPTSRLRAARAAQARALAEMAELERGRQRKIARTYVLIAIVSALASHWWWR